MPTIQLLPEPLINQIAAGEVVERPASVVKELVENALDAGARAVEVEVEQGGRRRIRVRDDGCGMEPPDARMALTRHATSKIHSLEDLNRIDSLGFRGEALPAIASVSRLTLVSAPQDGDGIRIETAGGRHRREGGEAHPRGTTVEVEDLFFNTPARAKFLRSAATEIARIVQVVQGVALSAPELRLRVLHDGRELLATPPAADRRERVRQLFGGELAGSLLPLAAGSSPLRVEGFISGPSMARANRSLQFLFVNGRPVADRTLAHAVGEGCASRFPRGRFPAVFLFLEVPTDQVDVNVHPTKREVRFRTPGAIHDLVRRGIDAALQGVRPAAAWGGTAAPGKGAVQEAIRGYMEDAGGSGGPPRGPAAAAPPPMPAPALPAEGPAWRVLGQFRHTYIVVEEAEGLLLVDQHAAHERILYDRLREEMERGPVPRQALLLPVTMELTPAEMARITELQAALEPLGLVLEPFGRDTVLLREVPAVAAGQDPSALVRDLIDESMAAGAPARLADLKHRLAALWACHGSVRAGMRLETERQQAVVDQILGSRHAPTCPHGRPAVLRYPLSQITQAFLRP